MPAYDRGLPPTSPAVPAPRRPAHRLPPGDRPRCSASRSRDDPARSRSPPSPSYSPILIAACGGGTSAAPDAAGEPTGQAAAQSDAVEGAATSEQPQDPGTAVAPLAALVPADKVQAALGETPTPECDTSVLSGAGSCIWTAADGSWLKVEDGTPREMPDLESFTARVTGTLGLDEPVAGLGEAAYLGTSSRGTRIAVYLGDGRVAWVVLNKPGDVTDLVTEIATAVTAGL